MFMILWLAKLLSDGCDYEPQHIDLLGWSRPSP